MRFLLPAVLLLTACPPGPVPPPNPPDASDAAPPVPTVLADATPPPTTPCQAACSALQAAGCPEGASAGCPTVLAHIESARLIRTPSGQAFSCGPRKDGSPGVSSVHTTAEAKAQGVACGP